MDEQPHVSPQRDRSESHDRGGRSGVRFDAVVHPGREGRALDRLADFDLDRIPDRGGAVRVLVNADECAQLLDAGYEIHLHAALPVQPLPEEMVTDDESVRVWLEERVKGIDKAAGS